MSTGTTVRSVADALQDAASWRSDEEARHQGQVAEVEQQLATLRQSLADLQEKIEALEQTHASLGGDTDAFARGETQRAHDGIFAALDAQRGSIEARSTALLEAEKRRLELLESVIADSDMADKLEEYRQFKETVEPSLSAMPESYRSVVFEHHAKVAIALQERIDEMVTDPVHADGEELALEVAFAVDAPEGSPELLVVVVPVSSSAHEDWEGRAEDLQTRLAARAVQAIYQACHEKGLDAVELAAGGHRGLLAIEAEVIGVADGFSDALGSQLTACFRDAMELVAAKVSVSARAVDADHLLGLVEEDEDAE